MYNKNQEASYNFRLGFALSKRSHLHRAYLVTVCNQTFIAVYDNQKFISQQHLDVIVGHVREKWILINKYLIHLTFILEG